MILECSIQTRIAIWWIYNFQVSQSQIPWTFQFTKSFKRIKDVTQLINLWIMKSEVLDWNRGWSGLCVRLWRCSFIFPLVSDLPRFLSPPEPDRGVIRAYVALQRSTVTWYTTRPLYTHLHCRAWLTPTVKISFQSNTITLNQRTAPAASPVL